MEKKITKKKGVIPKKTNDLEIKKEEGITIRFAEPALIRGQSSIELKRNSKGQTEIKVKVYNDDPIKAKEEASSLYEELNKTWK